MTPEMIAALSQSRAQVTAFFEFGFASGTRRLMLGSGEVSGMSSTILDETGSPILDENGEEILDSNSSLAFVGMDPAFGAVVGGEEVREDTTGEAPNTSVTITVADGADKAAIASDSVQLTPVTISLAALTLNESKRLIAIPDPEVVFDGFIDQAIISLDKKRDEVDYTLISAFDYFFEDSEGQRLNGPFHKSMYPTETGLDNVTGVTRKVYWGTYGPNQGPGGGIGGGRAAIGGPTGGFVISNVRPV